MISKKLATEMNKQITEEFRAAAHYLAMAAYLDSQDWNGMADFMKAQVEEEREHGMKFYEFLNEVGKRVTIGAVEEPKNSYSSIKEVFETALEHERYVTGRIQKMVAIAEEENDYCARNILQWFVDEQVEEENSMGEILVQLERIGDNQAALLMLDQKLGARQSQTN
ncbi:MAG: ferritin [bacterium]